MTKWGLSLEIKVGLTLENQSIYINIWAKIKNYMFIYIDVKKHLTKFNIYSFF